jgi:predicted aspartyl protease
MLVKIDDTPVTVLCDTGAAHGMIREIIAKILGLQICRPARERNIQISSWPTVDGAPKVSW